MICRRHLLVAFYFILLYQVILSDRPQFERLPKDGVVVAENHEILLPCTARGSPRPKITTWLFNDAPVNFGRMFLRDTGSLRIPRAQRSDAGDYQCVAKNLDGGVASEKKRLIVAYFEKIPRPQAQIVTMKRNTFLTASPPNVVCDPPPKYIWKKDGYVMGESSKNKITVNGTLFISNLEQRDMGRYELTMENTFLRDLGDRGPGITRTVQVAKIIDLKIYGTDFSNSLKIIHTSPRQIAGEDRTAKVTLECFVNGEPIGRTVSVEWFKLDRNDVAQPIASSEKYIRRNANRRLEITKPTYRYDNGKFLCVTYADNEQKDKREVFLDAFEPPRFLLKPIDTVGYTDNYTSINCTTTGPPYWTQRWYRNGIPVKSDGNKIIIHPNNTLTLKSLNWEDDGFFQCAAENYAALNYFPVRMEVKNISARIVTWFRDLYVGVDTTVEVPCVAVGAPKPKIYWLFNLTRIVFPDSKYSLADNGSLIINGMTTAQNGYYVCNANNYINIDQKEARVWIVVVTRFTKIPDKTTYARRGENKVLPCEVEHDPKINYTRQWRYNDLVVTDPRYYVQRDGGLRITHAQEVDNGREFSCHVFSYGGNLTCSTTVVIVQLPLEPSSPVASEIQAYSLRLTWDAPADGGSKITGYKLYMKNYTQTWFVLLKELPAVTTFLVNNLLAGSKHKFQVSARNKFGDGVRSEPSRYWIKTQALAPSAAPSDFRTIATGTDSITLAWKIPRRETQNGDLLGFYIAYRLAGYETDKMGFTNIYVEGGERITYKMKDLPLFTRYEIRIAAYNRAGAGVWSSIHLVETMQGKPSAKPTNVSVEAINDTAVYVMFTSPPQELWHGKLTTIVAKTWPPDRPQDSIEHLTEYDHYSLHHQKFVLRELTADRVYILSIAVATTGGQSPGSDWVMFRTKEGVPDAVRDLQVSGIYSDAFTVSWRIPKKPAGQLKGYKVKWRLFNVGIGTWKMFDEGPYARGAVISGLQPRTRYEVQVAAFTGKGIGTYMGAAVRTIEKPELPSAPSSLKAYTIWGTNISLGFTPGYSGRAVIHYYLIEYNNDTAYEKYPERAVWRLIKNLTKILENPANITGLIPNTKYRFRMKAFNVVGPSAYSNISADIRTSDGIPSKPPTNIKVEALERETLSIRWTPPAADTWNSGSIKYEFLVKPKGINERPGEKERYPTVKLFDTQATQYVAHGLQKYTMYNITMRLFNDKGYGPWCKPVFARTSEDYPARAPPDVRVTRFGTDFVSLQWGIIPEKYRNGIILGYKVYYQIKNVKDTELWVDLPGATTLEGTISGLAGYRDYEFRLLAYTKVGGTVKGTPVTQKTKEGLPGKPKDVRFNPIRFDYTIVRWNIPTNQNGIIIGYEVKYRKEEEGSTWVTHQQETQGQPLTARVQGLVYNDWYVFEIRGQTANGWGEAAQEKVLITNERSNPDSPVILTIPRTSIHTKSVILKWRPRFDGKAPIRSYNIEINEEFTGWERYRFGIPPVDDVSADLNQLEIKKLEPGTKYMFRIRANNDVGSSVWSLKSKIITTNSEAQMGAPVDSRVVRKTKTTLLIQWEPPLVVGVAGKLRGYKVKYRDVAGILEFTEQSVDANIRELLISNLKMFTAYEVSVGAFNDKGHGSWSPLYRWRTGEDYPWYAPTDVRYHRQGDNAYIRITWTPPSVESVRGYNLGYKIETRRESWNRKRRSLYRVCHSPPTVETHVSGPDTNEITLKNLLKYTRYSVTVRVYNNYGDGPKSRKLYFDTPKAVPGPPYILSSRVYINQVDIDFERPCEPNGRITQFKAVLHDAAGRPERTVYPTPERLVVKGLSSDTAYELKLSAKTSEGYGPPASIMFNTFKNEVIGPPGRPGAPQVYKNQPGVLMLKWETGDAKNVPVIKYHLEYKTSTTAWQSYRTIVSDEMRYDNGMVVYQVVGLIPGKTYRFRVKSVTKYGTSAFSESSKPITALKDLWNTPVYKEIWFIFVLVILFLVILIIVGVCCYRFKYKKSYHKTPADNKYRFSNFEQAMIDSTGDNESHTQLLPPSRGVSTHASNASKRTANYNDDSASIVKSVKSSAVDDDDDTEEETRRGNRKFEEEENIANHYSNNPTHKTWQDSLDQKTKKQVMDEFKGVMDEKKRAPPERSDRQHRPRPGKKDITMQKNLARSNPELNDPESRYASVNKPPPQRRPGKKPIDPQLTRSQPDLNREPPRFDGQVNRAPSFLRATEAGAEEESDNESFQDVLAKEKTKREQAQDTDNNHPPNPYAPPPYDYNGAPPAYTPSETDEFNNDPLKGRVYYDNIKPRFSDSNSDGGKVKYAKINPNPNWNEPGRKSASVDHGYDNRGHPHDNRGHPPFPKYAMNGRHSLPPQHAEDDEFYDDDMDETGDMTLV